MSSILVIDDDQDIRDSLKQLLKSEGHRVFTAVNGLEGLAIARKQKPDLILVDIVMPVMMGWRFREEQKRDPQIADIPVFVLCADHRFYQTSGIDCQGFISKPFKVAELLAKIGPHLKSL